MINRKANRNPNHIIPFLTLLVTFFWRETFIQGGYCCWVLNTSMFCFFAFFKTCANILIDLFVIPGHHFNLLGMSCQKMTQIRCYSQMFWFMTKQICPSLLEKSSADKIRLEKSLPGRKPLHKKPPKSPTLEKSLSEKAWIKTLKEKSHDKSLLRKTPHRKAPFFLKGPSEKILQWKNS